MNTLPKITLIALLFCPITSNSFGQGKKRLDPLAIPEVTRDKVICFALYTVHNKTLKLTAQLYPLKDGEDRNVNLDIKKEGQWVNIAKTKVIERGWTAPFRVNAWDDSKSVTYRVRHGESATYDGIIQKKSKR